MLRTHQKIKILMIEKNISGTEIARKAGVDRSAIHHVIAGRVKSPRLRQLIADSLETTVEELWPHKLDDI